MTRSQGAARARPRAHGPAAAGFALLEAIVALALLAGTGMAMFAWIQQNMQAATRLRTSEYEARLLLSAQSLVQVVNPMRKPEGEIDAGDIRVAWRAELQEPERRNQSFGGLAEGPFRVGLYRMDVKARDLRHDVEVTFSQLQAGTRRDTVPDMSQ